MTFAIPLRRRPQPYPEPLRLPTGEGRTYVSGKGVIRHFKLGEPGQMAKTLYNTALRPNSAGAASKTVGALGRGLWADGSSVNDFWRQHQVGATTPLIQSTGFEQQFPLSVELVFEFYSLPVSTYDLIFGNAIASSRHAGFQAQIRPSGKLRLFTGDGTGATSSDLFSWEGTAVLAAQTPYHVIMSAGAVGTGNGEIFVNGMSDAISATAGTAVDIGYTSTTAVGFVAAGGNATLAEAFHGRVYSLAFFNRRIFAAEAGVRFRRMWRELRPGQIHKPAVPSSPPADFGRPYPLMSRLQRWSA